MKTKAILFMMSLVIFASSCSKEEEAVVPTITSFETNAGWECNVSQSCSDSYSIDLEEGSSVFIKVDDIIGSSVVRLGVYAPSMFLGSANILTGTTQELECTGQNESITRDFIAPSTGTYQFSITRDWGSSAGFGGLYHLTIISDKAIQIGGQTNDDVTSEATGSVCPI